MTRDLYVLLGVAPDASAETIATVCAQKLSEASDHNAKVLLHHAREVLCNPVSRAAYNTKMQERSATTSRPRPALDPSDEGSRHGKVMVLVVACVVALGVAGWMLTKGAKPAPPLAETPLRAKPSTAVVVERTYSVPTSAVQSPPVTAANVVTPETLYAAAAPSVVVVESTNANGRTHSRGSGVVIGPQRVITNCHVIDRAISVKVKSGATEFTAVSGTSDTYLDLCILQVDNLPAPEVKRGSTKNLHVGQTVYAIGAPQGLDRTLSQGLISALRETPDGTVIQTSAAISPGSSGGGLFDAEGHLIGITTFQTKLGQNLNFALPVDWLETMRTR